MAIGWDLLPLASQAINRVRSWVQDWTGEMQQVYDPETGTYKEGSGYEAYNPYISPLSKKEAQKEQQGGQAEGAQRKSAGLAAAYECVYTTLQQFYAFSSYSDILYNGIKASARDIVTNAAAIYTQGGKARTAPVVMADWTIRADLQKTDLVDSGTVQNFIGPDGVYSLLGYRPGEELAILCAQSHVVEKLRDMYQGELFVRGTPAVKPHDLFYLNDSYTHMYGLAEAGRVVHSISPQTGFVTAIKPDLIARHVEAAESWLPINRGLLVAGSYAVLRLIKFGVWARQAGPAFFLTRAAAIGARTANVLTKIGEARQLGRVLQLANKIKTGAQAVEAASAAAAAPTGGWSVLALAGALAVEFAVTGLINNLIKSIETFLRTLQTVKIFPLYLKDKPFVAGITGAKYLIAYGPYGELVRGDDTNTVTGSPGQKPLPDGRWLGPPSDRVGAVTSTFGELRSPPRYKRTYRHTGVDIAFRPENAPITSAQAGTVRRVASDPNGYGNYVVVDHGGGIQTLYAHLSSVAVSQGQKVSAGSVLGRQGSTGDATGPHLHFELTVGGERVDPLLYLPPACYQG